ncbi:MAG: DUF1810 domain-containing protein [Prevotella sp.]|nr:DUF1810 domain-containing protein [Prevotella sp.]
MCNIYNLQRFVDAQESCYNQVLTELKDGRKRSHWIWFIFPQQKGLGRSYNSEFYGLDGVDEARMYLEHPVLGARLRECCYSIYEHVGKKNIEDIMGSKIDVRKLKTSMKLFDTVSPNDIFAEILKSFGV